MALESNDSEQELAALCGLYTDVRVLLDSCHIDKRRVTERAKDSPKFHLP